MHTVHNPTVDLNVLYRLDLNLYPLFLAIYQQKSISKAALLLCMSQSAASHALQRLRQQLQDEVFIRIGQQMQPTALAEQLYPDIQQAMQLLQRVSKPQTSFEPQRLHALKLAVHDEIEALLLPKLWQHFRQFNPDIQIQSYKLKRQTMLHDLATQQLDVVFDFKQHWHDKINFHALFSDQFVLCSQRNALSLEDYLGAQHIGVSSRRTGILLEDLFLKQHQLSRHIVVRVQHYATALQLLAREPDLVLTLPQNVLNHVHVPARVQVHPVPIALSEISLGMYWHHDLQQHPRHQCIRQQVLHLFQA